MRHVQVNVHGLMRSIYIPPLTNLTAYGNCNGNWAYADPRYLWVRTVPGCVTVNNGSNGTVSGVVSAVQIDPTNGPELMVAGNAYKVSSVVLVQPASAATTATASSSSSSATVPATTGGS